MSSLESHAEGRPRSVIAICTKDRPDEVRMSCGAALSISPSSEVLVVDASATDATREVCQSLAGNPGSPRVTYRRANQAGLARQRNEAIEHCGAREIGIIHFIDDDTEVLPGYFGAIERRFEAEPELMGIGGVVVNERPGRADRLRRMFLLSSRRRGRVLRSGRNVVGQGPESKADDVVDWLSGCSMSYRTKAFRDLAFDRGLDGYSLGEDCEFSFRLSRSHRLAVEPDATCVHHLSPRGRGSARRYGCDRTLFARRLVDEYGGPGMSRAAFWWSTLGDVLIQAGSALILRDRATWEEVRGVVKAAAAIARGAGPGAEADRQSGVAA